MQKFGDAFKPVDDFFKKSFSFGHSVEVAAATDAGVTITSTAKVSDGKFSGSLKASKYAFDRLTLDKFEVGTDGKVATKLILKNAAPGTEVSFEGTDGTRMSEGKTGAVVGVTSVQDKFTAEVSADVVSAGIKASMTTGVKSVLLGVTGSFATGLMGGAKAGIGGIDALVGYKAGATQLALQTKDSLRNVQIGVNSKQGGVQVAARVGLAAPAGLNFGIGKGQAQSGVTFDAGFKMPVDGASLAVAAGSDGKVRGAYAVDVSKAAKLTTSFEVNAASIESDDHKVGTKLAFSF